MQHHIKTDKIKDKHLHLPVYLDSESSSFRYERNETEHH